MAYRTVLPLAVLTLLSVLPASAATVRVSPDDYFVSAFAEVTGNGLPDLGGLQYVVPVPGVSTGQIVGPTAKIVNPVTTYVAPGGTAFSEGNAKASADLTTASLHASGGPTSDPFGIGFVGAGTATLGDTLHFINPSAGPTAITEIGFTIYVDGILGNVPASCCIQAQLTYGLGNYLTSGGVFGNFSPATSNIADTAFSFKVWSGVVVVNEDITGMFSFEGASADAAVYLSLQALGQYQYADFGDTAAFSFDALPIGVSYTSASGKFLTGEGPTVPEPSTWMMLLLGFSGLGYVAYADGQKSQRAVAPA